MTAHQHCSAPLKQRLRAALLLGCAGAALIYIALAAVTLPVSPSIYPDEVMVTEYGRNILEHPTKWSVVWSFADDAPRVPTYWLGCVVQELACRLAGFSFLGARWSGVAGALVAAAFLLMWMRASGVCLPVCIVGSVAFLYDPLLVAVARSGRPDTWVMALGLAACWLVRASSEAGPRTRWLMLSTAGFAAGLAPFFWPSAVFLWILIASELLRIALAADGGWRGSVRRAALPWLAFTLGGFVAVVVCIGAVWPLWPQAMVQFVYLTNIVTTLGTTGDWVPFFFSFRANPLLLPFVAISCFVLWRRNWLLVLAAAATTFFMVQSLVYHFRAGYSLPVFYGTVMVACSVLLTAVERTKWKRALAWGLIGSLMLWNVVVSAGLRTAIALHRASDNDASIIEESARSFVGEGDLRVYDANMIFYYAGRKLGWSMFRPEVGHAHGFNAWSDEVFADFLRRVDVAIVPSPGQIWNAERFSKDEGSVLAKSGFTKHASFAVGAKAKEDRPWWDRVLLGGGPNYGTFDVYVRPGIKLP